jgi:hypothetical protein
MAKWAGETLYRFGAAFTKLKNPMRTSQKTDGKDLFRSGGSALQIGDCLTVLTAMRQ